MNVSTITIPKEVALEKLSEYRRIQTGKRQVEDRDMRRLYKAASVYPLLDVAQALKETGTWENGNPKLALARGDWKTVFYNTWYNSFSSSGRYFTKNYAIKLPAGTYPDSYVRISTSVPHVPPSIRPDDDISKYHILFEVQKWDEYPADPFLLKQISGWIFAVIREWELTDLERALLAGMR